MPISAPPPSWASIKNKPNTVSGFGITDALTGITTAQVLAANAGANAGDVGSYSLMTNVTPSILSQGSTVAGSSLRFANTYHSGAGDNGRNNTAASGTWRAMGQTGTYNATVSNTGGNLMGTVFLRVA
jgi:hypothetical protein